MTTNRSRLPALIAVLTALAVHADLAAQTPSPRVPLAPPAAPVPPATDEEATPLTDLDRARGWRLARTPDNDDTAERRLLGVLVGTETTSSFSHTPAREAFEELRDLLGIALVGRYRDDGLGVNVGIDPFEPITIAPRQRTALTLLEEMLKQCVAGGEECTWQVRNGFVEFGPKSRLSVPAARERRLYYVADLIMHIPDDHSIPRQRREVVALTVVKEVVETIEPDAWDYGQIDYDEPVEGEFGYRRDGPGAPPITPAAPSGPGGAADRPAETAPRRFVQPRKIAIIRYWRDVLIIDAPGYIHREVGGLPRPIMPGEGAR